MKFIFLGGVDKVTGSAHIFETADTKICIDCGMEQESPDVAQMFADKVDKMPKVDALLLTHAHLDHSGLIPLAVKKKKVQRIVSTPPTKELSEKLFYDSVKILGDMCPFSEEDIKETLFRWEAVDYLKPVEINGDVTAVFHDSSHIIGSASVMLKTSEGNVLYTGDIGTRLQKLVNYPPHTPKEDVHYLIIESTYGNKRRTSSELDISQFIEVIKSTIEDKGRVLIPVFAIGRLQEVLYVLNQHKISKIAKIYVDTPLGSTVTEICDRYLAYLPHQIRSKVNLSLKEDVFGEYETVNTHKQSVELSETTEPCVILSASGMLEGGRVLNHLERIKNNPKSAVIFVGYQAENTRGRRIVDGVEKVSCRVYRFDGFSAHADKEELINYIEQLSYFPFKVFITHGECEQRTAFKEELIKRKIRAELPQPETVYEEKGISTHKPLILPNNNGITFTEFGGKVFAPVCGWLVSNETSYEIKPPEWINSLFAGMKVSLKLPDSLVLTEREGVKVDALSLDEIKNNLKELRAVGILSNKLAKEFYEKLTKEGKQAAEQYVIEKHRKNPNTGKRRWNVPDTDKDPEILYETAYSTLMNLTELSHEEVYRILKSLEINI